jgi:hypothetical protein
MQAKKISSLILQNENLKHMIGIPEDQPGPFDAAIINLQLGLCPMCGEPAYADDFKDKLSVKEYEMSGLCMPCQDKVFDEDFWEGMRDE